VEQAGFRDVELRTKKIDALVLFILSAVAPN
jgi:hypothetical protein